MYLSPLDMYELYEIKESLTRTVYCDKLPASKFMKYIDDRLYVDVQPILRRKEFQKRVWLESCENYFILTEHITETQLATILAKYTNRKKHPWIIFVNSNLFSIQHLETSMYSYTVSQIRWEFFRLTTFLIRKINRLEEKHD